MAIPTKEQLEERQKIQVEGCTECEKKLRIGATGRIIKKEEGK